MAMPDGCPSDVPPPDRHHKINALTQEPLSDHANPSRLKQRPKVIREGMMVRYGRRKYGRSFIHLRYFVLEPTRLSYYKKIPSGDQIPIRSIFLDPSCRVEDKGMEHHHGRAVYALSVHNKKDRTNPIKMASFSLDEANLWKEAIEHAIEQHSHVPQVLGNNVPRTETKGIAFHDKASSTEIGKRGLEVQDADKPLHISEQSTDGMWSENESDFAYRPFSESKKKYWRLFRCENGLRIFEQIPEDSSVQGSTKAMKAVGVVEAKCEHILSLIMGMDDTRNEWDSTFHSGLMVEEVNGHTAILYHRLQLDWCSWIVWPRDFCYVRYWRRNENGSYVIVYRSQEHPSCPPQQGCVRAHIESGGFTITPLKTRPGSVTPRARVEHQIQVDLQGWGVRYWPSYQQYCLFQMLNCVAGLREWFSQCEDAQLVPRIRKMDTQLASTRKGKRKPGVQDVSSLNQDQHTDGQMEEDESDEDDDALISSHEVLVEPNFKENISPNLSAPDEVSDSVDWSAFPSVVARDEQDNARNSWSIPNGNSFRVRSMLFNHDRSKVPAGDYLMQLVSVDWFKGPERMDHLARRDGCAAQVAAGKGLFTLLINLQVPAATHYSMVLYFVAKRAIPAGSLLQRFIDGDDGFRNSRLKLIPSVPKGSWIVRQSVGSTPCILGKAVDCNYFRGKNYLEVDVDIGSSTVANGVLSLVFGVIASLVVDMAFLVQGNSVSELPERLIGAVRVSRLELSKAVSP